MDLSTQETEQLFQLEKKLLQTDTRHSPEQLATLLAEEFVEYGASGKVYDKRQTIQALTDSTTKDRIGIHQFTARRLAKNLALVTYRSAKRLTEGSTKYALRSSIWRQTRHGWRLLFHQGTPTE